MDRTHCSLGLVGMSLDLGMNRGWGSVEALHMALSLSKALEGGWALETHKALGVHRAVDMGVAPDSHTALDEGVAPDSHTALDEGVALDVALDTNKALNTAVLEDVGGVLDVDTDVGQDVGIADVRAPDTAQDGVEDRRLAVDAALHVASAPDRRHPRRTGGHSSGSSL